MNCPNCNSSNTKVIETRSLKDQQGTRRRRQCEKCENRFTTVETLLLTLPLVLKKNGNQQAFSKNKILSGLKAACQKRPVSQQQLISIAEKVCKWASEQNCREISSTKIGLFVLEQLKHVDKVSSIRFASVHQSFNDIEEFVNHLERNF